MDYSPSNTYKLIFQLLGCIRGRSCFLNWLTLAMAVSFPSSLLSDYSLYKLVVASSSEAGVIFSLQVFCILGARYKCLLASSSAAGAAFLSKKALGLWT